jgi:two-component system response regulator YesN
VWNIVIIDDDRNVLRGMKRTIPWEELDARWAGEAINGEQGLALIGKEQPDIVITDIYMPIMNGLDMIEQLRKQSYQGIIIILSGYTDFEYARQALRLNVDDYLSKPVTVQMIRDVLLKAINSLESVHLQTMEQQELKQKLLMYEPFVQLEWVKAVVTGTDALVKPSVPISVDMMKLWENHLFQVMAVEIVRTVRISDVPLSEFHLFRFAVCNILQEILTAEWPDARLIELHSHHMAVLLPSCLNTEKEFANNRAKALGMMMVEHIDRYLRIHIQLGLGGLKDGWPLVADSTEEAFQALISKKKCAASGMEIYEYAEDEMDLTQVYSGKLDRQPEIRPVRFYQQLADAVKLLQEQQALDVIDQYMAQLEQSTETISPKLLQSIGGEVWTIFAYALHDSGISLEDHLPMMDAEGELRSICTIVQLRNWLTEKAGHICKSSGKKDSIRHKEAVDFMIRYIHEHYAEDIRLSELAEKVFISRNYLSNIFRDATGETFNEYVTKVRIVKAKSMVKEGKFMVYEIAEKVGYKNVRYFSTLFKKHTGVNPTDMAK